ncbi:hypothetical protein LINPERPRIM_LOCUS29218 [Linum perenne]
MMHEEEVDATEFGEIICRCKALFELHTVFSVVHVRRDGNMVVHTLARQACNYPSATVGSTPPSWLCAHLLNICDSTH